MSAVRPAWIGVAAGPCLMFAAHAPRGLLGRTAPLVGIAAAYSGTLIGPRALPADAAAELLAAAATIACAALGLLVHPLLPVLLT